MRLGLEARLQICSYLLDNTGRHRNLAVEVGQELERFALGYDESAGDTIQLRRASPSGCEAASWCAPAGLAVNLEHED